MTLTAPFPRLVDELGELARHGRLATTLRRSATIAVALADRHDHHDADVVRQLIDLADDGGLAAIVAIESLAEIRHPDVDPALTTMLNDSDPLVRRHVAWRLRRRDARPETIAPLVAVLEEGGMSTLVAHRTLRRWATRRSAEVVRTVADRLGTTANPAHRARLVDLVGAIPDPGVTPMLISIATDGDEPAASRIAAIEALGERPDPTVDRALRRLVAVDDEIGTVATIAADALSTAEVDRNGTDGVRIAQLSLAEGLDDRLSRGGRGDIGGVASVLVSLGEALARRPETELVLTIGRGDATDAAVGALPTAAGVSYAAIRVGDDQRRADAADDLWEQVPALERGLRGLLRRHLPLDVLHLRMADAGTFAGSNVARALGVPVCFTVAPDPHGVIDSLEARGELDAATFADVDRTQHVWFRARLVERLAREADRLALFPRADPGRYFPIPTDDGRRRVATVAEGIDLAALRTAERAPDPAAVVADLARRLPPSRRGLPILASVGRLHPVKGMERIVSAWAGDPQLNSACNLVIVGGDLEHPSASEREVLAAIDRALPPDDPRRAGMVLLGGRSRPEVAAVLTAIVRGASAWPAGGVYVDGALKEEFGLAVLEALAAGLPVVAPSTGGPATYVEDGVTGVLVDPKASLAEAIGRAFGLIDLPGRAMRARRLVEEHYSIDTMAHHLAELYRPEVALL